MNIIVQRAKGKLIPDAYLEDLHKKNYSCVSLAFYDETSKELIIDRGEVGAEAVTLESFKTLMDTYKDSSSVYLFSDQAPTDADSLQPFTVLVDEKNNPTLAVMLAGDYSGHAQAESAHSPEFFAVNKYINPSVRKEWQLQGNDLAKLVAQLEDPLFGMVIKGAITLTGAVTFIPLGAPPVTFDKASGGIGTSWGWTSNSFAYVEADETKPTPSAKEGVLARGKRLLSGGAQPATTPAPALPAKPDDGKNKEGPREPLEAEVREAQKQASATAEEEGTLSTCPRDIKGADRKNWFRKNCTFVPQNWWEPEAKAPLKLGGVSSKSRPAAETKITYTRENNKSTGPADAAEAVILIPAEKIKPVQIHASQDRNGKVMPTDIKQLQALEAKAADFFEQIGISDDEAYDYRPKEWLIALGKISNEALALLASTWRVRMLQYKHDVEMLTAPQVTSTGSEPAPKPAATAAPAAGGLLHRRKSSGG
jgi:hypothetical protein